MEYSASGFSEPIVTILKGIFRTQKKSERSFSDDKNSVFKEGKAEIQLLKFFEERLYMPVAHFIQKIAIKVNNIQRGNANHGDIDLHIAYAFVTIVIFLLIIWWFA
jgi:hydrogenase-4 component B